MSANTTYYLTPPSCNNLRASATTTTTTTPEQRKMKTTATPRAEVTTAPNQSPTFGEFLSRLFGWCNNDTIYPPRPTTPNDITGEVLKIAFNTVGIYDPISLAQASTASNPRHTFDGFRCWDSVALFARRVWATPIKVATYSDLKSIYYAFNVGGVNWKVSTPREFNGA